MFIFFLDFPNHRKMDFDAIWQRLFAQTQRDFGRMCDDHPAPFAGALLQANCSKNRYSNVLPLEHTRVQLQNMMLDSDTNYINANFVNLEMDGVCNRYIATQAPIPKTLFAFWMMVLEHKTPVILALTKLVEDHREKCTQYWPSEIGESKEYGKIKVSLLLEITHESNHYTERHLQVKLYDHVHDVVQLHYEGWPDHGIPDNATPCINMFSHMERIIEDTKMVGLPIVHCSAGIGRAGTFITSHMLLTLLRQPDFQYTDDTISDIILMLRKCRMQSVQTVEQLEFVYRVWEHFLANTDLMSTKVVQIGTTVEVVKFGCNAFNGMTEVPTAAYLKRCRSKSDLLSSSQPFKKELSSSGEN